MKYTIGQPVIVSTSWGNPSDAQTTDQKIMATITFAYMYSGEWIYRLNIPADLHPHETDFKESAILESK